METKEFNFKGVTMNGFFMLFVALLLPVLGVWGIYRSIVMYDLPGHGILPTILLIISVLLLIGELFILNGFMMRTLTWKNGKSLKRYAMRCIRKKNWSLR